MEYELFFAAVWQLVDTWCETTNKEEYCQMPDRLIRGVTKMAVDEDGEATRQLQWKKNDEISFDPFFVSLLLQASLFFFNRKVVPFPVSLQLITTREQNDRNLTRNQRALISMRKSCTQLTRNMTTTRTTRTELSTPKNRKH